MPDILERELYRLAEALRRRDIPLIIGGGYGLLLRQRRIAEAEVRTLRPMPRARSTEDLDVFFAVEIMCDTRNTRAVRGALDALGYDVIDGRENYQFARTVIYRGQERPVKVDLLAPTPRTKEHEEKLKVKARRLRPKGYSGLHAHPTPEAVTLEEHLLRVKLDAALAPEEVADPKDVPVFVPHPFTFVVLKLFAYRDRKDDPDVDFGQHHAYDLYRAVAMMTEEDWKNARELRDVYEREEEIQEARRIASTHFGGLENQGVLALRAYARKTQVELGRTAVEGFIEDLGELLKPET